MPPADRPRRVCKLFHRVTPGGDAVVAAIEAQHVTALINNLARDCVGVVGEHHHNVGPAARTARAQSHRPRPQRNPIHQLLKLAGVEADGADANSLVPTRQRVLVAGRERDLVDELVGVRLLRVSNRSQRSRSNEGSG
jgi:hypothetical protein